MCVNVCVCLLVCVCLPARDRQVSQTPDAYHPLFFCSVFHPSIHSQFHKTGSVRLLCSFGLVHTHTHRLVPQVELCVYGKQAAQGSGEGWPA